MNKILSKINRKTVVSVIVGVAGLITTVDQLASTRKQEREFEEMKQKIAELEEKN